MDSFEQMYEIVTAFNDDGFKAKIKEVGEAQKALSAGKKDHDAREAGLARREKEASVVLNSQETFNKQHADRMKAQDVKQSSLAGKKKQFDKDQANAKADLKAEEDRLKEWAADLTRDQTEADAVLKTKERAKADAKKAADNKALWESRVAELGLKVA